MNESLKSEMRGALLLALDKVKGYGFMLVPDAGDGESTTKFNDYGLTHFILRELCKTKTLVEVFVSFNRVETPELTQAALLDFMKDNAQFHVLFVLSSSTRVIRIKKLDRNVWGSIEQLFNPPKEPSG